MEYERMYGRDPGPAFDLSENKLRRLKIKEDISQAIEKAASLPKTLARSAIHQPSLLMLFSLIAAGAIVVYGMNEQRPVQTETSSWTGSLDYSPPSAEIIPPAPDVSIRQYMDNYLRKPGAEKFDKLWNVTTTELVQTRVNVPEGIYVLDFPDIKIGKKVPTGQFEPYFKLLKYHSTEPIEGLFQNFIVVKDPKTEKISIWAVSADKEGKFETFAVYFDGWLVKFTGEDSYAVGGTISGEDLFAQAHPSFQLPRPNNLPKIPTRPDMFPKS